MASRMMVAYCYQDANFTSNVMMQKICSREKPDVSRRREERKRGVATES